VSKVREYKFSIAQHDAAATYIILFILLLLQFMTLLTSLLRVSDMGVEPVLGEKRSNKSIMCMFAYQCIDFAKIFRAPVYRAHRAVIFAVAQLSCCV